MLKRVAAAACMIFFSLVFAVFSCFYVENVGTQLEQLLESSLTEDEFVGEISYESIRQALSLWDERKPFFGILLTHSASREISDAFSELEFLINSRQSDSVRESVTKCIVLLKSAVGREKFTFGNIF